MKSRFLLHLCEFAGGFPLRLCPGRQPNFSAIADSESKSERGMKRVVEGGNESYIYQNSTLGCSDFDFFSHFEA